MESKVVLVTGGGQGLGRGMVAFFLQKGWCVGVLEQDDEACEALRLELGGESLCVVRCDVGEETQVKAGVEEIVARWGRLDGLVNNAGIASAYNTPLEQLSLEEWERKLRVNLTGPMLVTKHCVPALRAAHGAVVNIASTRASQSEPHQEAYAASKGGLLSLTHAMAISLGPAIRVNCVSPGWIAVEALQKPSRRKEPSLREEDHAQHPVGRVGKVEDIASTVAFLLSEGAGFLTGQEIIVDGGMTKKMIYLED